VQTLLAAGGPVKSDLLWAQSVPRRSARDKYPMCASLRSSVSSERVPVEHEGPDYLSIRRLAVAVQDGASMIVFIADSRNAAAWSLQLTATRRDVDIEVGE